jgi:hypothetical protein
MQVMTMMIRLLVPVAVVTVVAINDVFAREAAGQHQQMKAAGNLAEKST